MRGAALLGFVGLALLVGSPAASAQAPRVLDQTLAADLEDVPLTGALKTIARRLGLELLGGDGTESSLRVTAKVPRVSAEVLLLVLAWETNREWVLAPGVLRWGPPEGLPADDLAKYRRERALRLERKDALLRRRLTEPLRFRLKVDDVTKADVLRFLQREFSLPLFLDPRADAELSAPVRQQFSGPTLAEVLDRLLSSEAVSASANEASSGSPAGEHPHPGEGEKSRAAGAGGSLGWTVVGDVVIVSTPAYLYSLRSLSP